MNLLRGGIDFLTASGGMHGWAMATAAVVSAAAAVVGSLLVVRRMSLIGDAISHAVLPGIVVGVLLGGRPGGPLATAGAVAAAMLTVWLAELLRVKGRLSEDAAAGVVFTTLFAGGVRCSQQRPAVWMPILAACSTACSNSCRLMSLRWRALSCRVPSWVAWWCWRGSWERSG